MPRKEPQRRTPPVITPWSRSECRLCAAPVTIVILNVVPDPRLKRPPRVSIDRRVHPDGLIAARPIGQQMHGYRVTSATPLVDGYNLFREHETLCPEITRPEQHPLPGTTK